MTIRQLQLFKDIAQQRSVSRGAEANGISQSAASQYLLEAEKEIGLPLLDRRTRPLALTEAGELYLDMCRDVLRRREEFTTAVGHLRVEVEGTVRVASIYSVGLSELAQLESEFARRYPEAELRIEYLRPEKVYEAVAAQRADLGLVSYAEPTKDIAVVPWREEQMVVAVSPYHLLAASEKIQPAELEGLEFVAFDEDLPIRRDIDRFLRERHVHVKVTLHFDNIQMIKEAVAHGAGISIMPARAMLAEVAQGRLVPVPLAAPELFRPVRIIHRRRERFHRAAQAFLDLLMER
jgi:LysR family transcriptional regulator, transcriptional activator of the cysJI operon